jgi:uncharacterized protein
MNSGMARQPEPLYFGSGLSLFGMYYPPSGNETRRSTIIICAPPGEEFVASHRTLRVLSTQLTRAGYPVLRFDLHGCGDSGGDDLDVDLRSSTASVTAAVDLAKQRAPERHVIAVGVGIGANASLLAAAVDASRIRGCLLWNPVFDVDHYLGDLRDTEASRAEPQVARRPNADGDPVLLESQGFRLSRQFAGELRAIDWHATLQVRGADTVVIDTRAGSDSILAMRDMAGFGSSPEFVDLRKLDWSAASANGATVPAAALARITSLVISRW